MHAHTEIHIKLINLVNVAAIACCYVLHNSGSQPCPYDGDFRCSNGGCVRSYDVCNGGCNCSDCTDELNCGECYNKYFILQCMYIDLQVKMYTC